jgi:hypothetical protein
MPTGVLYGRGHGTRATIWTSKPGGGTSVALTDRAVEMLQQALAQADVHASGIRLTAFLDPSFLQTTTL